MTMFWGESPEDQARYNLRFALWSIRKVVKEREEDPDPLLSTRNVCQVNPDLLYSLDAAILEEAAASPPSPDRIVNLTQAIELYKGNFLDGFALRGIPEWEEWLSLRRNRLHQTFTNASLEVADYSLKNGQPSLASTILLRALSFAPDLEQAHASLIRAYADMGRTSAALRQFNVYAQLMRRECNAPPAQRIVNFTEELRQGSYNTQASPDATPQPTPITPPEPELILPDERPAEAPPPSQKPVELPPPDRQPDIPFIGRAQEL